MNPPTEQLIRDYLNRVSVAARDRLGADQRRALIARTREFIEHNTQAVGQTGSAAVSRLLSELGDPADLVEREREQLNGPAGPAGPGEPGPGRSRRGRAARRHLADLMAAQAVAVVPGSEPVPEAADDAPLTGEREYQNRPITARWKPGAPMVPKQARPPGARRAAITRRLPGRGRDGGPARPGAGPEFADLTGSDLGRGDLTGSDLARSQLAGSAGSESAAAVPPLPADVRPGRPQWPSLAVRPAGDPPAAANGSEPAIPRQRDGTGAGTTAGPDSGARTVGPGTATDQETSVGQGAGAGQGTAAEEALTGPAAKPARPAESVPSADSHTSAGPAGPARPASPDGAAPARTASPDGAAPARTASPDGAAPGEAAARPASPDGAAPGEAAARTASPDGASLSPSAPPAHSAPPADSVAPALAPGTGWARGVRARGTRRMRSALTRGRGVAEQQQAAGDPARDWAVAGGGPGSDPAVAGPGAPADSGPRRGRPALPPGLAAATVARARRLAVATAAGARRQPLETTAVVLLGLGGLIYPPVWLMGALVALASRVWDHRDKWIGLGAPVLLVIAGIAADVSLDTEPSLMGTLKEAWLFGGHICRIAALLGAVYLTWRAQRGRRPPTVPPWNKPRRIV